MKLQDIFNDNLVITLDQLKSDSELVQQIEIRLKDLDLLDESEVDGNYTSETKSALTEFCRLAFLNNMTTSLFGRTFAKKLIEMPGPIPNPSAGGQAVNIDLTGSVGAGGTNKPGEVKAVKNRLVDLGFNWVGRNSTVDSQTIRTIKLFQSIINGRTIVAGDGRIDVNQKTHEFLQAANAPRWQEMPLGSSAEGFINYDHRVQGDNHDFGSNWMIETIQEAGKLYKTNYHNANPGAALIATNNLSVPRGGDSPFHNTHEAGISCDIVLPRKDGTPGGIKYQQSDVYDQDAMEAMLRAIRGQNKYQIKQIFFNDPTLIVLGLCQSLIGHDDHAHIDIVSPQPN